MHRWYRGIIGSFFGGINEIHVIFHLFIFYIFYISLLSMDGQMGRAERAARGPACFGPAQARPGTKE
jgi:uncharacterized membrane protein